MSRFYWQQPVYAVNIASSQILPKINTPHKTPQLSALVLLTCMENIHLSLTFTAVPEATQRHQPLAVCVCDPKPDSLFLNLIRSHQQLFFSAWYLFAFALLHALHHHIALVLSISLPLSLSLFFSPSLILFLCPLLWPPDTFSDPVGRQHTFHLAAEFSDPALSMADKSMLSLFPMPLFSSISLCYLAVCEDSNLAQLNCLSPKEQTET